MATIFGDYLKGLRIDRGLTLRQIEEQTHISNGYLSQVEKGRRNPPTMKKLVKLAKVLGVPSSTLSDKAEEDSRERRKSEMTKLFASDAGAGFENFSDEPKNIIPNPNTEFICRAYESLSEEKKRTLKDFLIYLQKDDKGKKVKK